VKIPIRRATGVTRHLGDGIGATRAWHANRRGGGRRAPRPDPKGRQDWGFSAGQEWTGTGPADRHVGCI